MKQPLKHTCPICKKAKRNRGTCDKCKTIGELRKKNRTHEAMIIAAAKCEEACKEKLSPKVNHWDVSMGREALVEMFPDLDKRQNHKKGSDYV